MKHFWESCSVRFIRDMVSVYFAKNVGRSAAELAYYLIMTFFPILICINAFFGLISPNASFALEGLSPFLPESVLSILKDYLGYISGNQSTALLIAGLLLTIFSASAAMRSLMNIMSDVYGKRSYPGFWSVVASFVFSILFLVTIYLSIAVVLTGSWFFHFLENTFHVGNVFSNWQWIRYLVLFALVLFFILLLYRASAPREKPRPPILTGAVLASLILVAASMLFSFFISLSSRYSLVYGSLASVIILLVWLYLCGNILILGNVFNYVWYTRKKCRYDKKRHSADK